jgi:WD40 repeat protein
MLPGSIAAGRDEPAPPRGLAGAKLDGHGDPLPKGAVARFGTVRHRQETPIWQVVYSPDGRLVATEGDDPEVRIWDGRDGRLIRRIDVGPALIRIPLFSPDSRTLAVASYRIDRERRGYVVDVIYAEAASGTQIVRGPWMEQDSVSALALSPDLALLATATSGGTLRLRDAQDGRESARFLADRREIRRLAFDRRGHRLAALSRDEHERKREGRVDVVDVRRKEVVRVIPDLQSGTRLTLSPEGNVVCVSDRYQIECRDAGSGQPVQIGHLWGEDAAFSSDGRIVADFHWPQVDVNDVASGAKLASFENPGSHPTAWALSPDGATVAAGGGPTTLHLWEIATGCDRLAVGDAHSEPVRCLLFSPDGRTLITGGEDKTIRLWDAASGAQRKVLQLAGRPRTLTLSPEGLRLATAQALTRRHI